MLDYLKSEHAYGNKYSRMGKSLEKRFSGTPYGWDRDVLRLILATLFRAGEIEVTYQGNRFHNYQDPAARTPFTNNPAFKSSLFSPRQSIGLKTLTEAVKRLEDLTGQEVDVEEGAIATAFKKVVAEELEKLHPLKATAGSPSPADRAFVIRIPNKRSWESQASTHPMKLRPHAHRKRGRLQ